MTTFSLPSKRPLVSTIHRQDWATSTYDASFFALGFEARAVSLLDDVKGLGVAVAFGFDHGHERSYEDNKEAFKRAGMVVYESIDDAGFEVALKSRLSELEDGRKATVFADISCFSRFRLAAIVHEIFALARRRTSDLVIDFGYSVAKFETPFGQRRPNTVVGPAHRAFAGWSQGGYSSTAAVLGLGYEQDQALGAVEYLQAGEVWAFTPSSPVEEYKPAVAQANQLLLDEIPAKHVIEYDVCVPDSLVTTLESVVRGLADEHSVVLVPFGPKIFVLCSLVVAAMRQDVAVWRVSQGSHIQPHDRHASMVKVGLRLEFAAGRSVKEN